MWNEGTGKPVEAEQLGAGRRRRQRHSLTSTQSCAYAHPSPPLAGQPRGGDCPQVRFEDVEPRHAEFGDIVTGVYQPVHAKHYRLLTVLDNLAIVVDPEFSWYKDGTRSADALVFLKGSYGTCRATAAGQVPLFAVR